MGYPGEKAQHKSSAVVADLQTYFKLDPHGPESDDARSLLTKSLEEMN
jgi:hypothetical protein